MICSSVSGTTTRSGPRSGAVIVPAGQRRARGARALAVDAPRAAQRLGEVAGERRRVGDAARDACAARSDERSACSRAGAAGQRDGGRDVGRGAAGDQRRLAEARQQARADARGVRAPRERHHRHAHPQRLAGGGRAAVGERVERDVDAP